MMRYLKTIFFTICILLLFVGGTPVHAEGSAGASDSAAELGSTPGYDGEAAFELHMLDVGQGLSVLVKAGSHYLLYDGGGTSSSTFYFLNQVLPDYVFLSCGEDNPYSHPAAETMERLQSMDCDLYRTDKQGTVIAYSDGSSLWFSTDPCTDFGGGDSPIESERTATDSSGNITYVRNTNTHKFHYEYCDSVDQMKEKNKLVTTESRDSLIAQGYVPCKNCSP